MVLSWRQLTRAADVYSFGIIIRNMFVNLSGEELPLGNVEVGDRMPTQARRIMELACHETAVNRPDFEQLEKTMRSALSA